MNELKNKQKALHYFIEAQSEIDEIIREESEEDFKDILREEAEHYRLAVCALGKEIAMMRKSGEIIQEICEGHCRHYRSRDLTLAQLDEICKQCAVTRFAQMTNLSAGELWKGA